MRLSSKTKRILTIKAGKMVRKPDLKMVSILQTILFLAMYDYGGWPWARLARSII